MPAAPSWSTSARIAKFREKAATLHANPLVQEVTHVRTRAVRLADGTFQVEGTRADPDRLRLLMLDARVFEQRNDSGGVALETINNAVVQELKRLGSTISRRGGACWQSPARGAESVVQTVRKKAASAGADL